MQQVLGHKHQRRRELAALPFPEQVRIVEQMRKTLGRIRASTPLAKRGATVPRT